MTEQVAIWGAQAAVAGAVGLIGWFVRRMISDFEKRADAAERNWRESIDLLRREASESAAAIRREIATRDSELKREDDLHVRRCELIQTRLANAEQRGAADQAVLRQVGQQLSLLSERIDAIYRILTEARR